MTGHSDILTFRDWGARIWALLRKPSFMAALLICTAAGYWVSIAYPGVGMDDTAAALDYYVNQGGLLMQGRFTKFLIQRVIPLVQYDPRPAELVGVILLVLAGVAFAAALLTVADRPAGLSAVLAAGTLAVYPLQAELFVFTEQSAYVGFAFLLTTVGSFCLVVACQDGLRWRPMGAGILLICLAVGCYEAYLMAALTQCFCLLLLLSLRRSPSVKEWFLAAVKLAAGLAVALVLKVFLSKVCLWIWQSQLENVRNDSASEIRWITEGNIFYTLNQLVREFLIDYVATAFAFFPLALFWGCALVIVLFGISWIRKKNWSLVCNLLILCGAQFLLSLIQGRSQLFRTCQSFAPFCGFALWMAWEWVTEHPHIWRRYLAGAVLTLVMAGQIFSISGLFQMDSLRWKYEKSVLLEACQAVYQLENGKTKPVVFVGQIELPQELRRLNAVNDPDSISQKIAYVVRTTMGGGNNQLQKSQNLLPNVLVLNWGQWAFQQPQTQIHDLANSLGYPVEPCTQEQMDKAKELSEEMEPGEILETEEMIVVRFRNTQGS